MAALPHLRVRDRKEWWWSQEFVTTVEDVVGARKDRNALGPHRLRPYAALADEALPLLHTQKQDLMAEYFLSSFTSVQRTYEAPRASLRYRPIVRPLCLPMTAPRPSPLFMASAILHVMHHSCRRIRLRLIFERDSTRTIKAPSVGGPARRDIEPAYARQIEGHIDIVVGCRHHLSETPAWTKEPLISAEHRLLESDASKHKPPIEKPTSAFNNQHRPTEKQSFVGKEPDLVRLEGSGLFFTVPSMDVAERPNRQGLLRWSMTSDNNLLPDVDHAESLT
ncbi:9256_t:CDS:2 [Scutellospora calospora]|uniref:9256_t:CDS:1 n=1 Tax=Scutellospora calospora TaxID=85575 RepID=A0ACA9M9M6_9GLOM|nr:9256_t:CDS:2 [Scutellospora calospora]